MCNYTFDIDYIVFKINCNRWTTYKFDIIDSLKSIKIKYKNSQQQNIILHLAMQYYIESDLIEAAKHFLEAIQMDPESQLLKVGLVNPNSFEHFSDK